MIEFLAEHCLPPECNKHFICFTYDGKHTYLGTNDKEVYILGSKDSCMEHVRTCRQYHTLCYDFSRGCFFAASLSAPGIIFQLSQSFEELEPIKLDCQDHLTGNVNQLFYDVSCDQLYFLSGNQIYCTDDCGNVTLAVSCPGFARQPNGICSLKEYFLCLFHQKQKVRLLAVSKQDGTVTYEYQIFPDALVRAMILLPGAQPEVLRLLVQQRDNTFSLLDYQMEPLSISCPEPEPAFFSDPIPPIPPVPPCPSNMRGSCNCNPENRDFLDVDLDTSNFDPFNFECGCSPTVCCHHALANLIESIALNEASLAHILNAEGEKLQKAIQSTSDISELLRVNESVQKTIIHCTHLEQILYNKLEAIVNFDFCDCQDFLTPCSRDEGE